MDWKLLLSTFGAVFFAEMADKTQVVGLSLTSKSGKPLTVWLGSVSAYMVVTAITVVIGLLLGKYLKPEFIRYGAGTIFLLLGILIFAGKL